MYVRFHVSGGGCILCVIGVGRQRLFVHLGIARRIINLVAKLIVELRFGALLLVFVLTVLGPSVTNLATERLRSTTPVKGHTSELVLAQPLPTDATRSDFQNFPRHFGVHTTCEDFCFRRFRRFVHTTCEDFCSARFRL